MDLFCSNGRVFREGAELFTELSWLQVMHGQGLKPHAGRVPDQQPLRAAHAIESGWVQVNQGGGGTWNLDFTIKRFWEEHRLTGDNVRTAEIMKELYDPFMRKQNRMIVMEKPPAAVRRKRDGGRLALMCEPSERLGGVEAGRGAVVARAADSPLDAIIIRSASASGWRGAA